MKILFVYPNHEGYFRVPIGLTLIMTVCEIEGHDVGLFDTTFIASEDNLDSKGREKDKLTKPIPMDEMFTHHTQEEIVTAWIKKINDFKPDLIAVSILEDAYKFADVLLSAAKKNFNIPIVVGGVTPTMSPDVTIENPNIDMIVQNEGEIAFKELLSAMENKTSLSKVPNLWYKDNGEVKKNALTKYMNMNELPNQRLHFWDEKHFMKPYNGKMLKSGNFEMSRGCMHKCHYCFNRFMQIGFEKNQVGAYRRNKTVDTIIREVLEHHKRENFEIILFSDDNFLGRSFPEMEEFYERWAKEVKIPYWINTCIETVNEKNAPKLKKSQCIGIGIGMETGSEWVRRNILLKGNMTNKMYVDGFKLMARHGIRSTCNVMIGFPGEYEEDVFDTIKVNKVIRAIDHDLTSCTMSFVAPYAGTVMHNISVELGLIKVNNKPGFRGLCDDISMSHPNIHNPNMSKERMFEIREKFTDYVNGDLPIPEKYLISDPDRKYAIGDPIYEMYSAYKQGPRSINPNDLTPEKNRMLSGGRKGILQVSTVS
jgi:radical SAM superfamily enzyme YgiQ (UPF0313 family)